MAHADPNAEGTEFFYVRIDLDGERMQHLLKRDGAVATQERPRLTFYQYAHDREEAQHLVDVLTELSAEILGSAHELSDFLDGHFKDK